MDEDNTMTDRTLIFMAVGCRAAGISMAAVILPLHLSTLGLNAGGVGAIIGVGLAAGGMATLAAGLRADSFGRRRALILLAVLACVGGCGLSLSGGFAALAASAAIGMFNGMGRDRGAALSIEQSILSDMEMPENRTAAFAKYNVLVECSTAAGGLLAAMPAILRTTAGMDHAESYRVMLAAYGLLCLLGAAACWSLSPGVEARQHVHNRPAPISERTKNRIYRLSSLFALDSLGGGFLTSAILSYWFFRRFGVDESVLGPLFFAARLANAVSYPIAARLAGRIGLIRTMVFTHIPSSLILIAIPFLPTFKIVVVFFLLRELLVQMDVPTRQSYVMAVVEPEARTFAAGVTNFTRNTGWAVGPFIAGQGMSALALSMPLFTGAVLKLVYDLWLYAAFRHVRPEQESG